MNVGTGHLIKDFHTLNAQIPTSQRGKMAHYLRMWRRLGFRMAHRLLLHWVSLTKELEYLRYCYRVERQLEAAKGYGPAVEEAVRKAIGDPLFDLAIDDSLDN